MSTLARMVWAAAVVLTCGACTSRDAPEDANGVAGLASCPAPGRDEFHLPPGLLAPDGDYRHWNLRLMYGALLRAMDEPSLYCGHQDGDAYRMSPIQWFGAPVAVRIAKVGNGVRGRVVSLEAPAIYVPPGKVVLSREWSLTQDAWDDLERAIARAGFWRMPTTRVNRDAVGGTRRTVILEGRRRRNYHVVSRSWDGPETDPYFDLGAEFLALAGLKEADLDSDAPGVVLRRYFPQPDVPEPPPPPAKQQRN